METITPNSKNRQPSRKPKSYYTRYTYQKRGTGQTQRHFDTTNKSKTPVDAVSFYQNSPEMAKTSQKRNDKKKSKEFPKEFSKEFPKQFPKEFPKELTKEFPKTLSRQITRQSSENTTVAETLTETTPQPQPLYWLNLSGEEQGKQWVDECDKFNVEKYLVDEKEAPHSSFAQPETIYFYDNYTPTFSPIATPTKKVFAIKDPNTGLPLQLGKQTPFPPFAALLEHATNTPQETARAEGLTEYAYQHELCEFMVALNSGLAAFQEQHSELVLGLLRTSLG
eukprot:Platyproteum_vivax@DN12816_c0_g1_i1.p1